MKRATTLKSSKKRPLQFRNGIETMRTMFLSELHRQYGICMTCKRPRCEHASGTDLPGTLETHRMLEVLNEVAERYGAPRL
jgi:hypothetical protein